MDAQSDRGLLRFFLETCPTRAAATNFTRSAT